MYADKITYRNGPRENYSYKNLRFETLLKKKNYYHQIMIYHIYQQHYQ